MKFSVGGSEIDWEDQYNWLMDGLKTKGRIELYDSTTKQEIVWVREKSKKRKKKNEKTKK
jgi:hypothetical protein